MSEVDRMAEHLRGVPLKGGGFLDLRLVARQIAEHLVIDHGWRPSGEPRPRGIEPVRALAVPDRLAGGWAQPPRFEPESEERA